MFKLLQNELVISEPRRRTQIKRYGHDESVVDMSELDSSSESDEDPSIGVGRGRGKVIILHKTCAVSIPVLSCFLSFV
jgi:hypothetical protein